MSVNRKKHKCYIKHCKNAWTGKNCGIIFHRLPSDPSLYQIWLETCKIKTPHVVNFFVCSDHFKKDDYIATRNWDRRRLKKCAVPSIFPVEREKPIETSTDDLLRNMQILRRLSAKPRSRSERKRKRESSPPAEEIMIINLNEVYIKEENMLREVDESDELTQPIIVEA